jgi:hypothetical protein
MKLFVAKNIFEANKFCYFFSKIMNYVFVVILKDDGKGVYKFKTTRQEVLRFLLGFAFALYIFYDTLATKLKQEKRSIIFEIILVINGKMQTLHATAVMLQVFINREEYFKILNTMHWIDNKVNIDQEIH